MKKERIRKSLRALAIGMMFLLTITGFGIYEAETEEFVLSYLQGERQSASFVDEPRYGVSCLKGTLPESYSSSADVVWDFEVQKDYVTPVRNQNPYGTCWAHSAICLAETSYIMNMLEQGKTVDIDSVNFNEYHLVNYYAYTPADPLGLYGGDYNIDTSGDPLNSGGNVEYALRVLANWIGASDNTDFSSADVGEDNSDEFGYDASVHLQNGYIIAMPDMLTDNYQADMDIAKEMIMKYGAIGISYCSNSSYGDERSGYYYCPDTVATNHAVTVVGWDDTISASSFATQAPGDGAWLVKNSWGTYGDMGGYFWLSYYDQSIWWDAYVYDVTSADNYDNNYQYDGTFSYGGTGYSNQACHANAFVADSDELLEAVGFYTLDVNVDYEIRIYKNLEEDENPQDGELILIQSGHQTYEGFHTVELNASIPVSEGERYAVVIMLTKMGSSVFVAYDTSDAMFTVESYSFAKAGESYVGYTIESLADMNPNNATYAEGENVRIKAYTNEDVAEIVASGSCGEDTTWELDEKGRLYIQGTGDMTSVPWQEYMSQITQVEIAEGVTSIAEDAFEQCDNLELITIYNPNCIIVDDENTFPATATIEGYVGSTAQRYAQKYERTFIIFCVHIWDTECTVDTESTCAIAGTQSIHCSICDEIKKGSVIEIELKEHEFTEWEEWTKATCQTAGIEIRSCQSCSCFETRETELAAHEYMSEVIAPTCMAGGHTVYTCIYCGDYYNDDFVLPAGHTYGEWVEIEAAGCETMGEKQRTCIYCDAVDTRVIESLGHDYERTIIERTCTEKGYTLYDCKRCDYSYETNFVKARGHEYEDVIVAPTCTEQGYTTHSCKNCDDSYVDTYVNAAGHTLGDWEEVVASGCESKGQERKECANCDYYEIRELDALGHEYESVVTVPTCTEKGYTTHACKNCEHSYVDTYVDATGHTYGDWLETVAPDCETKGQERRDCASCEHYETRELNALGHEYENAVTAPTCTEEGYTTHNCKKCDYSYVDTYVDATGHVYGEWTETKAPTTEAEGEERRECENCNHYEVRDIEKLPVEDDEEEVLTGWQKIDGKWYYYNEEGKAVTGWKNINKKWYFFNNNAIMQTGWLKDGGCWYYLNADGDMATSWKKVNNKWYYFGTDGKMSTSWRKIGTKWYYFNTDGDMATNWKKIGTKWYYFNADGDMHIGWKSISGTWYYFNADGDMHVGWKSIGGTWYYFNSDGNMHTGWKRVNGTWYYFTSDGAMVTGRYKINGTWNTFTSDGAWVG